MKKEGMGRRFTLSISRVLQSCRPAVASPAFGLSPVNPKARDIDFPPPLPIPSPSLRRIAPVVAFAGCRCAPRRSARHNPDADAEDLSRARGTPAYLWRKEGDHSGVFFQPGRAARRREKKKKPRSRARISTSSADSGWFSTEDEENDEREVDDYDDDGDETETLLSSFETDSLDSVFLRPGVVKPRAVCWPTPETRSPERAAAVLRRLAPEAAEGKVRESFAVVKKSEDPKGDFRRSMAEMVLEKQIYDAGGLEQLLHCFLSLNSDHHHPAIVAAFSDIWDAIFPAAAFPHSCYK